MAHEISHSLSRYTGKLSPCIFGLFIVLIILNEFFKISIQNVIIWSGIQILIFLISIALIHKISWYEEFFADANAFAITKDSEAAISFFKTATSFVNDYLGIDKEEDYGLFNLLIFDHPLTKDRIKKIKS